MNELNLHRTAHFLSPFYKRTYDKNTDDTMGLRRILHECENDPTPELTKQLDAVDALTAVLEPLTEAEWQARECEEIEDKFGHMSAPFVDDWSLPGYDYWNPADHIPADPSVMSQKGWVCNSKRAAIKAAYEKQLHEEYNALWK